MQVYHSMTEAARGIVQRNGVRGLYTGLGITLVEIVPYAALQFGLYDTFTVAWSKARRARLQAQARETPYPWLLEHANATLSSSSRRRHADWSMPGDCVGALFSCCNSTCILLYLQARLQDFEQRPCMAWVAQALASRQH